MNVCHGSPVWALIIACVSTSNPPGPSDTLRVRISWGHESAEVATHFVKLVPLTTGVEVRNAVGFSLEKDEGVRDGAWQTQAGKGDIDGVEFTLAYPRERSKETRKVQAIWTALIEQSDPDTAQRLRNDAAFQVDAPMFMVQLDPAGTRGFSVSVEQLLRNKAMWVPSLGVYLTAGEQFADFADCRKDLEAWQGKRILERVQAEPEATYEQFTGLWDDMGDPRTPHPSHVVGVTWDSAIPKFGVDRLAGVRNDLGNPHHFSFSFDFAAESAWKRQSLADGLPIITTVFEKEGLRYEIEQFAYPLAGAPSERRGDIAMVLVQKLTITEREGKARTVMLRINHGREFAADLRFASRAVGSAVLFEEERSHRVLFAVEGAGPWQVGDIRDDKSKQKLKLFGATTSLDLPAGGVRELIVKLPSPTLDAGDAEKLLQLDYARARSETTKFWSDYLARGARIRVPEKTVNDLCRANLWHALRLPRRHGGQGPNVQIDLPYCNFAYGQKGTPWPVNQSVYVDYMLYDLRGYHDISSEELLVIYRSSQQPDGRVGGVANWGVYTPGMMYSVGKHFLLSQDRDSFERLLPPTLKALDWCLAELKRAAENPGPARGLVRAPLNDGTGAGFWAFNQAYMFAGLDLFGRALKRAGHPRAQECLAAAQALRQAIERGFGEATARSPLVQLRDHTWIPYVPCEVSMPRRLIEQWYPTDVDTGATHLLRLRALPAAGPLADYLLHDHEDNLYLKGWGMANEPVYNQQATAHLLRDDVKAVVRAFYSYMASAFSHSVLEPVEHRWAHGQYFGPPSTDGAWFELYRNMLIRELDDDTLLVGHAIPRAWLKDGKKIEVERAPTYFGKLSLTFLSQAETGTIAAEIDLPNSPRPGTLLVRFRHPTAQPLKSATVNGKPWSDLDPNKEWVRIRQPDATRYTIIATYR